MPIVEKKYLYEVLLRFRPHGLVGAHQIEITRVEDEDSGYVYVENIGIAAPVDTARVADVIGAAAADMMDQISILTEAIEAVEAENATLRSLFNGPQHPQATTS